MCILKEPCVFFCNESVLVRKTYQTLYLNRSAGHQAALMCLQTKMLAVNVSVNLCHVYHIDFCTL